MSFVRPEAIVALTRWREVAIALAAAAFGLWVATRGGYFYAVLGGVILAFALGFALSAWRRLRFAPDADAPGMVEIDEGAIAYFGPETGGVVALSELDEVQATAHPSGLAWRLHQSDGTVLTIPAAASGADQLFDVFGALPGASTRPFLAAVEHPPAGTLRLWRRRAAAHEPRLPRP
ncbi:MAG: hypothetical protein V2I65_05225 [Paracoccaceae bacterium]|nr:hypothetical protein [Paracoccaceae bacterium]